MEQKGFVHLHVHTEYSLLDGAAQYKKLIAKAKEQGAPAVAMTDHGNMYAAIKFYNECKEKKIKPIIGCEFYVAEDMHKKEGNASVNKPYHLVLIAKNHNGFQHLAKLNSLAYLEGFYYKPRIDLELLKEHTEDVICCSACLGGAIPRRLMQNDYEGAKEYAVKLRDMFAPGDFYIELQDHGLEEQKTTNPLLYKIAKEIGVKCIATNDVHYLEKEDAEMQDVLLCIQTGRFFDEPDRMRFPNDEFYYKSYEEMAKLFDWCPEVLETPYEIADKCDIKFTFNVYQLPRYVCPDNLTPPEYLRKLCYEGLERRYGTITDAIRERAESELNVIIGMGFSEYYLIVWDFIFYARSQDIPVGPGRGSGVGSIVAYAIGITSVDPLKYDLIFERFLNVNRTSMPDFDVDFCFSRRLEVIEYCKRKYGEDHISQIITFGKMKRKAAIKDVARVFRLPFSDVSKLTKSIGNFGNDDKNVKIKHIIDPTSKYAIPDLIEQYNSNPEYKRVIDIAQKLEDMPRNTGMHAAGVVIYKNPSSDTIPLAKNGDEVTTQFNMTEVERLGLLKMDFLALMTLTDIKMAHDYVLKRTGRDIDFDKLGYEDPAVYDFIGSGDTDTVFQLEGGGMKKFMARFRPHSLEEIIAGISLYRPGPMDNIDVFLENRKHPDRIPYKHPSLAPILGVTYGVIVYQEQAMMITRALAGYDMTRADSFRAIISKKKADKIPIERDVFVNGLVDKETGEVKIPGCVRNGIPEETARAIFAEMESFASYAFNKSHAAAYSVVSYQTAFYKHYYPVEFIAAVINNRFDKPDDVEKYMRVMKSMGIPLYPPDINKSDPLFSPEGNGIRYGLACIKNVGLTAMEQLTKVRTEGGLFTDYYEFVERMNGALNKRALECLIRGGALDCFGLSRATMIANLDPIVNLVDAGRKHANSDQFSMFELVDEWKHVDYRYQTMPEYPRLEKLLSEKEMLGMYVSGHPLEGYEDDFKAFNFNTSMLPKKSTEEDGDEDEDDIPTENDTENAETAENVAFDGMDVNTGGLLTSVSVKRTKDGKEMAVCILEDMYGSIELLLFSRAMAFSKKFLIKDTLVRVRGKLSIGDEECKITCNSLAPFELNEKGPTDTRTLYLNFASATQEMSERINQILESHRGSQQVKIQLNKKIYLYPETVGNVDILVQEIGGILGPQNVKAF